MVVTIANTLAYHDAATEEGLCLFLNVEKFAWKMGTEERVNNLLGWQLKSKKLKHV
jgi:hypothetical protein